MNPSDLNITGFCSCISQDLREATLICLCALFFKICDENFDVGSIGKVRPGQALKLMLVGMRTKWRAPWSEEMKP